MPERRGDVENEPGAPAEPIQGERTAGAGDAVWLERLLDTLSIGAFSIDQSTQRLVRVTDTCARLLGYASADAAVGTSVLELYADPKERQEIATRLLADESFRETGVARIEVRRLRQDTRTPVELSMTVTSTLDPSGRLVNVDGIFEHVRERGAVDAAFRASEARFRTVFDESSVGMALADLSGHVYRVNAALCRFLRRPEGEILGAELMGFMVPEDRPDLPRPGIVDAARAAGGERRFRLEGGELATGDVTWSWLSDDDGTPHTLVVLVQDVTERRRLEQGLLRMAKLESLGVLAGGIAHDFNNILAVILGSLTLAARTPETPPAVRELLDSAEGAAKRARELAQQLITFARGGVPVKRVGSLGDVARESARFCLRGSNVAVDLALPHDLWPVELDEGQMSQVFHNLLINGAQAMPAGGRLRIEAENVSLGATSEAPLPAGRHVRVRVIDEGQGIEPAHLDRIFDPYFSTKSSGSGLGLATAHSIVTQHGGYIAVASEPGRGATFTVYLPASEGEAAHEPAAARSSDRRTAPARVLVMDDDASVRRIIAVVLRTQGLEADLVGDGREAIDAYRRAMEVGRPYAAVLLDLTVPGGLGGVAALEGLRALDPGVRAIVSSGYSEDPVLASCREHGFVGRVVKPFTADELDQAVRDVLDTGPS